MKKVENFSVGYALLKVFAFIPFRITHRNYIVNGLEHIPTNQPVIFAPNHQNALLDPLAILFATSIQPVFLARADIFKNKWIAHVLYFLKILPVYRIRDGKDTLTKNEEVFDDAVRILQNKKMLCLFPEASHIGIKSMLPHKKAIPRIVFIAAEKTGYTIDIQIVPVGINYSSYYGFRRKVTVNFGLPLQTKSYYPLLKEEGETKASIKLRDDIFEAVRPLVVHVPDKSAYVLFEEAFAMTASLKNLPKTDNPQDFVPNEQFLTQKIADYLQNHPEGKTPWVEKAKQYQFLKKQLKIKEKTLTKPACGFWIRSTHILLIIIGLPLSLWGVLSNGWLYYLTRYPYRKAIKDPQFYSSVSYVLTLVLFPLWFVGEYFILETIFRSGLISLGLILLSIPGGIMAWESGQFLIGIVDRIRVNRLSQKKSSKYKRLISLRSDLVNFYQQTVNE